MAKIKAVSSKKMEAITDLLDRLYENMPSGRFEISEADDDDAYYTNPDSPEGIELSALEAVIDVTISEFQTTGVLRKRRSGTYTLTEVFEHIFGKSSSVIELAADLESALIGYQDMISSDDIELAKSLIDEIKEEMKNASTVNPKKHD